MKAELYIKKNNESVFLPIIEDSITLQQEMRGAPSKLTFTVIKDQLLSDEGGFNEGVPVALYIDGKGVFLGYVFTKSRDKAHHIECVAYDQLRYLKNKATYVYTNKTASEVVKMIAEDFKLVTGTIEDTGFKISQRIREDETMFDVIQDALDLTFDHTRKDYVLFDDFGKITLKNIENMQLNTLIDDETAQNFDYSTSIDDDTYNYILLVEEVKTKDGQTKRVPYTAKDDSNIDKWGRLVYFQTISETTNAQALANSLLKLKNRKTRKLTLKGCFGDINVRAGSSIHIVLNLGDVKAHELRSRFVCESVTHTFQNGMHLMDLTIADTGVGK